MKKVLIVEDDMILSMLNRKIITTLGYEVVSSARDGKEAIEAAGKYLPDYILMDVRLKGDMDGIMVMEEIEKKYSIPVIYISGNSDPDTLNRAQKTNMLGFLIKPISSDMLKALLPK